jgi:hypothetical protein
MIFRIVLFGNVYQVEMGWKVNYIANMSEREWMKYDSNEIEPKKRVK